MKILYIVVGECGNYSDWRTWDVCAYLESECAKQHLNMLNKMIEPFSRSRYNISENDEAIIEQVKKELDPKCASYDKPRYHIEEVKLVNHVDEFKEHIQL